MTEITRVNSYSDSRFSQRVLHQHGCFLVEDVPYEIEIASDFEAVIRGANRSLYPEIIDEFRFYAPHITKFRDADGALVLEFPAASVLELPLEQIQPSQFYVDESKIAAIKSFIHAPQDIIIQAARLENRYVSLDGHTRLYYAATQGWGTVRAAEAPMDAYISDFVAEARTRGIFSPKDMLLVGHREYEEKWNGFCDTYFENAEHQ